MKSYLLTEMTTPELPGKFQSQQFHTAFPKYALILNTIGKKKSSRQIDSAHVHTVCAEQACSTTRKQMRFSFDALPLVASGSPQSPPLHAPMLNAPHPGLLTTSPRFPPLLLPRPDTITSSLALGLAKLYPEQERVGWQKQ